MMLYEIVHVCSSYYIYHFLSHIYGYNTHGKSVDVCQELSLTDCAWGKKPVIAEQHKQQQNAK